MRHYGWISNTVLLSCQQLGESEVFLSNSKCLTGLFFLSSWVTFFDSSMELSILVQNSVGEGPIDLESSDFRRLAGAFFGGLNDWKNDKLHFKKLKKMRKLLKQEIPH